MHEGGTLIHSERQHYEQEGTTGEKNWKHPIIILAWGADPIPAKKARGAITTSNGSAPRVLACQPGGVLPHLFFELGIEWHQGTNPASDRHINERLGDARHQGRPGHAGQHLTDVVLVNSFEPGHVWASLRGGVPQGPLSREVNGGRVSPPRQPQHAGVAEL